MKPARHSDRWAYGDQIIYRGLWKGFIWWAIPVTVVQDTLDLIALYWPAGTPMKRPEKRATARDVFANPKPVLADHFWTDTNVLMLCREGDAYSINAMWSAENGDLLCWYVNLQAPLHRMEIGFETEDHLLDVVFQPDLGEWEIKDEDELAEAGQLGVYSDDEVKEVLAAAEEAIQNIITGGSSILEKWATWAAPKSWGVRGMPSNWNAHLSEPYQD
jgi:predicted RNA-binding protein associated with RNAse of E/G family